MSQRFGRSVKKRPLTYMWTALGLIGSAIIGGAVSAFSTHSANDTNKALADRNNNTSINLANTSHQREVADLEAAGLNPVLSAGGQGSAVPQLTTAQVSDYSGSVNSALSQLRPLLTGEVENKASATAKNFAEIKNLADVGDNLKEQNRLLKTQEFKNMMDAMYPGVGGSAARSLKFGTNPDKMIDQFLDGIFTDRSTSAKSLESVDWEKAYDALKAFGDKHNPNRFMSPLSKDKKRSFNPVSLGIW